ncbi:MAG: phosphopantothenoylcysteine decarboxylase, partial [Limnobacter sp.]|nr:phosphopantothenoylcysteine decarboxylase [Limnobacter sp.]
EPEELVWELARLFTPQLLTGETWMLTAGPTFEAIDPVRGITNLSSGKMGYALAQAAWLAGAEVQLVSGPTALDPPYGPACKSVQSARDMHKFVLTQLKNKRHDGFIGVAAVADYGVANPSSQKQKKAEGVKGLSIQYELNPDILAEVGELAKAGNPNTVVGFAAETQNLETYATGKLKSKNANFIVGNLAQQALGADHTQVTLFGQSLPKPLELKTGSKLEVASELIQLISQHR